MPDPSPLLMGQRRSEPMAALRDASWYRNPQTDGFVVWHVVGENGDGSACNPNGVLLVTDSAIPASEVKKRCRCRRSGCAKRWPK